MEIIQLKRLNIKSEANTAHNAQSKMQRLSNHALATQAEAGPIPASRLFNQAKKRKEASMTFGQFVKVFGYVIVVASAIGAALEAIARDKK